MLNRRLRHCHLEVAFKTGVESRGLSQKVDVKRSVSDPRTDTQKFFLLMQMQLCSFRDRKILVRRSLFAFGSKPKRFVADILQAV